MYGHYTSLAWGGWCCVVVGGNFGGLLLIASNSELVILAVEGFRVIKPMEWLIWFRI